jgi:hypothetical protein
MRARFQERLNECLEALSSGQRTLDECLAMYPQEADRLEPLLRTALRLRETLSVEPRSEFAAAARQRFVVAGGQGLMEALRTGPRPSFVRAARARFLAAAQRMVVAGQGRGWRVSLPQWAAGFYVRPLTAALTFVLLLFLGFGGFAVSTSGDALPGDWNYSVKRATENVRLTFAFSEGARRDLNIELAGERLEEIQGLADKGRPIGGGVLNDLKGETDSLVGNLDNSDWDSGKVREVAELAQQQQEVLGQVDLLVKADAQDELAEARTVSQKASVKAQQAYALALFNEKSGTSERVGAPGESEGTPEEATETPPSAVTPTEGPGGELSTPAPTPVPEGESMAVIEPGTPLEEGAAGVVWDRVVIDRFSVEVPSEASGWRLAGLGFGADNTAPAPDLLRITNSDSTAMIVINPRNGDTFWYQYKDGLFEEFIVRVAAGDEVWQADLDAMRGFYAAYAEIVLYVVESINIEPPPMPTPTPTPPPTATPTPPPAETATVVASGVERGVPTKTPVP